MADYITLMTAGRPDPVAVLAAVKTSTGDATAVLVPIGGGAWRGKKATTWTAPQIAAAQTLLDTTPAETQQLAAQRMIDRWPLELQAAFSLNDARLTNARTPTAHHTSHQAGEADELNVADLLGVLGDSQNAIFHAASHQSGGPDELIVDGLSGTLADPQTPLAHTHPISDVVDLQDELEALDAYTDTKQDILVSGTTIRTINGLNILSAGNMGLAVTSHLHAGVYEPADANIQAHIVAAHAPADAQKNSNILKAEIEAVLTGAITSHTHAGGSDDVVFAGAGVDVPVNVVADATIITRDVTGVVAGDKLIVDAVFTILNNSTATRVYNITLDFDGLFDIEMVTGALAFSATLMHPFRIYAVLDIRSTSLAYAIVESQGGLAAGIVSGGDPTMTATRLGGMSWGTNAGNLTGTTTVALKARSALATATQTLRLHLFTIRKVTP